MFDHYQSKWISTLLGFTLLLYYFPAFATSSDGFLFKVLCEKSEGVHCSNESTYNSISINKSDIQCISESVTVDTEKNNVIHNSQDSFVDIFSGKIHKNDTVTANPNYNKKSYSLNFTLTEAGGYKLALFTSNHIGRPLQMVYNGKVLTTAVVQSPLSKRFQLSSISEDSYQSIKHNLNLRVCGSGE